MAKLKQSLASQKPIIQEPVKEVEMNEEPETQLAEVPALNPLFAFRNETQLAVKAQVAPGAGGYIQFAHPNSTNSWAKIAATFGTPRAGHPYLFQQDPKPVIALDPMRFSIIAATQYWALESNDSEAQLIESSFEEVPGMKECIETILMLYLPDGCEVTRCTFKTTKCPAAHKVNDAIKLSQTKDWAALSEAHKLSLQMPDPRFRSFGTVKIIPKQARQTLRKYEMADAVVSPTTAVEWVKLSTYFQDQEKVTHMNLIAEAYEKRLDFIKSKCK